MMKVPPGEDAQAEADEIADKIAEEMAAADRERWARMTDAEHTEALETACEQLSQLVCESISILGEELRAAESPTETLSLVKTVFSCYGQARHVALRGGGVMTNDSVPPELLRQAEERLAEMRRGVEQWAPADGAGEGDADADPGGDGSSNTA